MSMLLRLAVSEIRVEGSTMDAAGPYPYSDSLVRSLATIEGEGQVYYHTKFGVFEGSSEQAYKKIEECIENVEYFNLLDGKSALEGMITRVELFREYGPRFSEGLVAFDDSCVALFHATYALLGHEGSEATFCRRIFAAIGIPNELFERVNSKVRSGSYTVIISREKTEIVEGVKVSKFEGYKNEWECWFDYPLV